MGNLLAATASIGVPLFTHTVTLPFLFHPLRWGGVPWAEPHWILLGLLTFILNVCTLMVLGTMSGLMTTKGMCNRTDVLRSIKRSLWVVLGYIIGNLFLFVFPFVKAPFLVFGLWLPYAGWLVHGFLVSIFILLTGSVGNTMLRSEVC